MEQARCWEENGGLSVRDLKDRELAAIIRRCIASPSPAVTARDLLIYQHTRTSSTPCRFGAPCPTVVDTPHRYSPDTVHFLNIVTYNTSATPISESAPTLYTATRSSHPLQCLHQSWHSTGRAPHQRSRPASQLPTGQPSSQRATFHLMHAHSRHSSNNAHYPLPQHEQPLSSISAYLPVSSITVRYRQCHRGLMSLVSQQPYRLGLLTDNPNGGSHSGLGPPRTP
jgi:hypothetical protein